VEQLTATDRVDLLKHLYKRARDEIDFLRKRQDRIFTWSSSILVALIGALLIIDPSKNPAWSSQGHWGKLVASIAVLVFVAFSIRWQQRNRQWHRENAEVATRIEHLFHCFEEGYFDPSREEPLFPERWKQRGKRELKLKKRILSVNYVSATALLGVLAIVMIWLNGR
jgi:hypothetical protein